MADENGSARITLATLGAHVDGLDRDYQELRRAVSHLDTKIEASMSGMATRFEHSLSVLTTKIDQRSTTQWGPIFSGVAVIVTVLGLAGTMAYVPISRDTTRLDNAVAAILDRGIFQRQYEADQTRTAGERAKLREDFNSTILARRYDQDQNKIERQFADIDKALELLRVRSYEQHGNLSGAQAKQSGLEARIDAISRRLADFIRDMGKS